jgi:hypothetical protein
MAVLLADAIGWAGAVGKQPFAGGSQRGQHRASLDRPRAGR